MSQHSAKTGGIYVPESTVDQKMMDAIKNSSRQALLSSGASLESNPPKSSPMITRPKPPQVVNLNDS